MATHNRELRFTTREPGTLYSPTLYNLFRNFDKDNPVSDFPRLKLNSLLRFIQDGPGITIVVEDPRNTEMINPENDPHGLADDDQYPLELFLNLNKEEIRHIHAFLGAVLNDETEYYK